jgi:ribosomal protein S12 methylthiotransferase accessory factor
MKITFPGEKKVNALYDKYEIPTDQPVEDGGGGSAPSPFKLFIASIATCSGYYASQFVQRRGLPLEELKMDLEYTYNEETHMIDTIIINMTLPKEFPPKYKNAIIKSIGQCAVKRHLKDCVNFEVRTNLD